MTNRYPPKQRVNWRQAAGEAVVLLAGVSLALMGQAWWESRSELEIVRGYVANLVVELEANRTGLEEAREDHAQKVSEGTALIQLMGQAESSVSSDSMFTLISSLTLFADFRPATAALDNLLGAGGLGLVDDPTVQLAVSRYSQAIADHNVLQVELADYQNNRFHVYLSQTVPILGTRYASSVRESVPQQRFAFDPQPLLSSLEFENVVLGRIRSEGDAATYVQRLLDALEALELVLDGAG